MTAQVLSESVVSTADYVAISDLLGRYAWNLDHGYSDEWIALWTEDGVFIGPAPEPIVGHEQLRHVPTMVHDSSGGMMRHLIGNVSADYGDTRDIVRAHYYNMVTTWIGAGSLTVMAVCETTFVRNGDRWLIKKIHATLLETTQTLPDFTPAEG